MLGWKNKTEKKTHKLIIILDIANIVYTFKVAFIFRGSILRYSVMKSQVNTDFEVWLLTCPVHVPQKRRQYFCMEKKKSEKAPWFFSAKFQKLNFKLKGIRGEEQKSDSYATSPTQHFLAGRLLLLATPAVLSRNEPYIGPVALHAVTGPDGPFPPSPCHLSSCTG